MLHYKWHPAEQSTKKTLVMLHGFISDQSTFDAHIKPLTAHMNVICVDLPGHGQDTSPIAEEWSLKWIGEQLHQILASYTDYEIYMHGYSMGARVALNYALIYGHTLGGLILESGTAGIQDDNARHERRLIDQARAKVLKLADIQLFVHDWEQLPLFQSQRFLSLNERQRIRQMRLAQQPHHLAKALIDYGTGNMPNLWPQLPNINCPTQLIVGEWDEKFVDIAQQMARKLSNSTLHIVPNVGHTVHVEDCDKFDTIVLAFILA
ncbi:2-succinyl-6-hydroxy-2,4-cyclohexadiene-1-carboxylate synthase [Staphylococcus sp. 17KM0847]|uniref:2-succinyl-6-hydroxy-2, 4-cyclohexadiene-1-carboxylate synthase n=1 Tax=Staphylococcus sp. 17KM0847 TaxID=2583989 RepID=UPI0015DC80FC|nr:2-succinyl-6-hydroxy-2,4-cyclohexadiene-1-carboxylate synthase [Staphylococcus sp. 17KM0847]QLK85685.1 2-succinyl-6-hydroxy-2,4-cyclohexadiene-1-carboxylate synthase [Staphylococcus sp. 17KM0847]